jgi:hypothetical protein
MPQLIDEYIATHSTQNYFDVFLAIVGIGLMFLDDGSRAKE